MSGMSSNALHYYKSCDAILSHDLIFSSFRSTAMAVTLAVARLGAILGNVVFGYLIEVSCAVPILLVASLLASGGLLGIKLPNTSNVALS